MSREDQNPLPGIARNISRLTVEREISIAELGRRSGIPAPRIEEMLEGEVDLTASDLLRIAGAIEVQLSQILEGIVWESDSEGGGEYRVDDPEGGG